jgi:hypothetical protein
VSWAFNPNDETSTPDHSESLHDSLKARIPVQRVELRMVQEEHERKRVLVEGALE